MGDPDLSDSGQWGLVCEWLELRGFIPLPNDYLVIDIETSGLSPYNDLILQFGFLQYINGEIATRGSVYLKTPDVVLDQYDNSNYVLKQKSAGAGYIDTAVVRERGQDPKEVFALVCQLYRAMCNNIPNFVMIGHNVIGFDVPFLEIQAAKVGVELHFDKTHVFDTGAFFKANALRVAPDSDESIRDFFYRVKDIRAKGVKWNLLFAAKQMGADKYAKEAMDKAHDAEADVLITHFLYQQMRQGVFNCE